jgi:tetratricopeptide (TPR) repeat protein
MRQAVVAVCFWTCAGVTPFAQDTAVKARSVQEPIRAQPAVLILRVTDEPAQEPPSRHLAIVQPRGLRSIPMAADRRSIQYAEDGTPDLGPGYELVRTSQADLQPNTHYYVYNVDFYNPMFAQRWSEFQRVQRAEARQARAEARNLRGWEKRKQQLLDAAGRATQEGVEHLRAGEYRDAVVSLTRAADLDQGDPACRIYLTLARVALGHDDDAAKVLRRALDLQQRLVAMTLGLERYYPHEEDFAMQVDALAQRVAGAADAGAGDYFLLGFMEFQCGWLDEAYAAFCRAERQRPKDRLIQTYLDITRPPDVKADSSSSVLRKPRPARD